LVWVNGMGCPLCATNVDQQLKRVRGVESVKINLGTGIVSVSLDPERIPAEAELAKAVRDSGFTLVRIQMPGSAGAAEGGGGA
jgi:copper chaperone CopZ